MERLAQEISENYGFKLLGRVGSLRQVYQFEVPVHPSLGRFGNNSMKFRMKRLDNDETIKWYEEQVPRKRYKRSICTDTIEEKHVSRQKKAPELLTFSDPYYERQWHLHGERSINVLPVWSAGITGKGVNVAVLDDGLFKDHVDLASNYVSLRKLIKETSFKLLPAISTNTYYYY